MTKKITSIFFGTPALAVTVLEELKQGNLLPSLIVTSPDKPQGRKLVLTPPPVKVWAEENGIPLLQPEHLNDPLFLEKLKAINPDLFLIAAYGKIIPHVLLDMPQYGSLNVHPSLLPLFRGPSPIQSQILEGVSEVGVTIMLIDEKFDHGKIIAQVALPMPEPLPTAGALEKTLAKKGAELLVRNIPLWIEGDIIAEEQDHERASFTKMITKKDGLLDLTGNALENYQKIRAFDPWPLTHFFLEQGSKKIRIKVTDADFKDGELIITRVIPEGRKEMDYQDFLRGLQNK